MHISAPKVNCHLSRSQSALQPWTSNPLVPKPNSSGLSYFLLKMFHTNKQLQRRLASGCISPILKKTVYYYRTLISRSQDWVCACVFRACNTFICSHMTLCATKFTCQTSLPKKPRGRSRVTLYVLRMCLSFVCLYIVYMHVCVHIRERYFCTQCLLKVKLDSLNILFWLAFLPVQSTQTWHSLTASLFIFTFTFEVDICSSELDKQ